ncbi:MAG TPA: diguanylate cyclase, partial [Tepidisphaeraceae bacterium]
LLNQLTQWLAATGERVCQAVDGKAALEIWREQNPRVIVSDWEMQNMNGVELCRQIRAQSGGDTVHFIMLTAHSEKSRLLDAYQAGVDDFIAKPFDPEELLARVRAGIRTAKLHDQLVVKADGSQALNAQLATVNSRLERLSITDELTGLFNRRHAISRLEEQWTLTERYVRPLSIALIDIDHFKRVNDTHGHDAGDAILRQVAAILREMTRGTDPLSRVGGEEFLIIFPGQSLQEARMCSERLRVAVESHLFVLPYCEVKVTVSIGIAIRSASMKQSSDLLKLADQVLYAAKHAGRNVVRTCEDTDVQNAVIPPTQVPPVLDPDPVATRQPVDLNAVLARCGGDASFANAVTSRFHGQAMREVDRIQQALSELNSEALSRVAHGLKSMAAYMAADKACELAGRIESLGRLNQLSEVEQLVVTLREEIQATIDWIGKNVEGVGIKASIQR